MNCTNCGEAVQTERLCCLMVLPLRMVKRFRGGLVFKAHRLLYHTTLEARELHRSRREGLAPPSNAKLSSQTPNPEPFTLNPQPLPLNLKLSTINPKH